MKRAAAEQPPLARSATYVSRRILPVPLAGADCAAPCCSYRLRVCRADRPNHVHDQRQQDRTGVLGFTGGQARRRGLSLQGLDRQRQRSFGAGRVAAISRTEVEDIEMVRFTEIEDWMDTNDWDQIDYRAVGRGVNADLLIAIDLSSLSYYEGATLYKGKAHYTITLYNMEKGEASLAEVGA